MHRKIIKCNFLKKNVKVNIHIYICMYIDICKARHDELYIHTRHAQQTMSGGAYARVKQQYYANQRQFSEELVRVRDT